MRRLAKAIAAYLLILTTLLVLRAAGLQHGLVPILALGSGVALGASVIDRVGGPLASGLAHATYFAIGGATAGSIAFEGFVYTLAPLAGATTMRAFHMRGYSVRFTGRWVGLLSGAVVFAGYVAGLRCLESLVTDAAHAAPLALALEAMATLVGVLAAMSIIVNLREFDPRRLFGTTGLLLAAFLASQLVAFHIILNQQTLVDNTVALIMVVGTPAALVVAIQSRSIGVGIVSTVWTAFELRMVLQHVGSATHEDFVLLMVYLTGVFLCSQMIHVMNRDRLNALAQNHMHAQELEARVRERTARLEAMTAQAMAADEAKSEFLAVMSHELRTPMNGVLGMSELLRESGVTDRQRMFIDVIRSSAQALVTIIGDILDFSRIENGRLTLDEQAFDTVDIGGAHLAPLALEAGRKGVGFTVRIDPSLPDRLIGDPARLRQIVINLVGNAVKFTDTGRIALDAREALGPDDTPVLRIELRDSGPGVPVELREEIFERFSQADHSATRRHSGAGLGLAICRGLAELMSGRVGVDARPGGGSIFWLEAPLRAAEDSQGRIIDRAPRCCAGRPALIVEPDHDQAAILSELLEGVGMSVSVVDDHAAALAAIRGACDAPVIIALGGPEARLGAHAQIEALRAATGQTTGILLMIDSEMIAAPGVAPDADDVCLLVKPVRVAMVIDAISRMQARGACMRSAASAAARVAT